MRHYLETLQQQILRLEFIETVNVDDEDAVVDEVTEGGADQEHFPAIAVRPRSSEEGIKYRWDCLRNIGVT